MAFRLSDSKSRLLALLGSGILVGTALAVIIPEGVNSLSQATSYRPLTEPPHKPGDKTVIDLHIANTKVEDQYHETLQGVGLIGPSLVIGFILMLLIDQFSIYLSNDNLGVVQSQSKLIKHNYSLANQDEDELDIGCEEEIGTSNDDAAHTKYGHDAGDANHHRVSIKSIDISNDDNHFDDIPIESNDSPTFSSNQRNYFSVASNSRHSKPKVSPTLGLVIHAAADGIALGAAATTSHRQVELIIFLAIMLHKAPAAFSLVVLLIHMGYKHSTIRRHLLAFSLSAPLAALVTYFGLSQSSKEALRENNATAVAMLFSAGTFLYVATVHVLPELIQNKILKRSELLCLVSGSFLPILLAQTV